MAHIILGPGESRPAVKLIINGHDFSQEVFREIKLVEVGDDPDFAEVGLQVTFAVSRLDLGGEGDVRVTDHLRAVAQRVRSIVEED